MSNELKKVGLVWVYVGINGLRMVDDADKTINSATVISIMNSP